MCTVHYMDKSFCSAVLYCTLLAKAETKDAREAIEEEMRASPEKIAILKSLSEVETEDLVKEERARKAAARKSKMDSDLNAEDADEQEKKAVRYFSSLLLCDEGTLSLQLGMRRVLDLVDLAFALKGHFMANKRCQLPGGSYRQTKKGKQCTVCTHSTENILLNSTL